MWERCALEKRRGPDQCWKLWTRKNGTDGGWQQEALYKEELELVRHSNDLRFEGFLMRRAYYAGKSGDWKSYLEEFLKYGMLSIWASVKVG